MLALHFDLTKLPRSMSRAEWRNVHRWRRVTQTQLREHLDREIEAMRQVAREVSVFGTVIVGIEHRLDSVINPRLLIAPYHDTLRSVEIKPGTITYA